MTVIDEARGLLEFRLADLNEEARRLERALAELKGEPRHLAKARVDGSRPQAQKAATRKGSRRRIAKRGQRAEEIVADVAGNEGTKSSEIAKRRGIAPSQVFALVKKLRDEGRVVDANGGLAVPQAGLPSPKPRPAAPIPPLRPVPPIKGIPPLKPARGPRKKK
jgi:hypothetical protein